LSVADFIECEALRAAGFEHGFGTRAARERSLEPVAFVRQVHGTRMLRAPIDSADSDADAVWTAHPGLATAVYTADCVPILLAERSGRCVAALHAGWRGSVEEIALTSVEWLVTELDLDPTRLIAAIGPHIGVCCYEVDAPVIRAVRDRVALKPARRPERAMLDLFELNRLQLLRAGIPAASIHRIEACTHCDQRFHSYRRDGSGGRMPHYVRMPVGAESFPS